MQRLSTNNAVPDGRDAQAFVRCVPFRGLGNGPAPSKAAPDTSRCPRGAARLEDGSSLRVGG